MKPYSFVRVMDSLAFTANAQRPVVRKREKELKTAYDLMNDALVVVESKEAQLEANVRRFLFVRLFNGVSGALLTSAHGLYLESMLCLGSALDAFCYDIAIQLDPAYLQRYNDKVIPNPEDLRAFIQSENHPAWEFIEEFDTKILSSKLGYEFIYSLTEKDKKGGRFLHVAGGGQDEFFFDHVITRCIDLITEYVRYA